jgi:integrase/recombinase XerC
MREQTDLFANRLTGSAGRVLDGDRGRARAEGLRPGGNANGQSVNGAELGAPAISAETVRRLLEQFLQSRAPGTLAGYSEDLDDFAEWRGVGRVDAVRELLAYGNGPANGLALEYRTHLVARELAPATINRKLAALRSLVKLARTVGVVTWALDVESLPQKRYRDTRGPGEVAVTKMLERASARADAKGRRDYAIMRLAYDLALRRFQIATLDVGHVDVAAGQLQIVDKGQPEREAVTLPEPTRAALAAWLELRGGEPGPLFVNFDRAGKASGARLTARSIHRMVSQLGAAVGVKARPHGLRHTAITVALDETGGDVRAVQQFSRHADVRTLLKYDDNRQDLGGQVAQLVASRRSSLSAASPASSAPPSSRPRKGNP